MGASRARPELTWDNAPAEGRKNVYHLGADDRSSTRVRIVDATLRCLTRQGVGKTTVDDIAREAGFSRATLYRTFPGGKDDVLEAVVNTEVARLFSALAVVMGEATDLEDVLVAGMVEAARRLSTHSAIAYLLLHEPGVILPKLTFADMDRILLTAGDFAAPFFGRWLEPDQASRAAEWAVRIVLAYVSDPSPDTDLTDPADTRSLVRTFVLPGILALRESTEAHPSSKPARPHTSPTPTKGAAQ
ncbi:MAG TPA: TetR/AcrR family transcriptional regulator [Acidimicrobiales bacterium]|nr:TetR/AcrR family transcriptional regulator [Acidimicrobiales bacterium]